MSPTPEDGGSRPERLSGRAATAGATSREWPEVVLALGLIAGLVVLLSLNLGEVAPAEPADADPLEATVRRLVNGLAAVAEIAAALVIGWGVVQALGVGLWRAVDRLRRRRGEPGVDASEGLRLRLGRMLALGVEFTLASDILGTAVAPTRHDILTLGAIVLLRTLLNLFLEREIREGEHREREAREAAGIAPANPLQAAATA